MPELLSKTKWHGFFMAHSVYIYIYIYILYLSMKIQHCDHFNIVESFITLYLLHFSL